ncbi:uncharacterized protein LOC130770621 [Actinidia eriantha]|uniref:uncharacterized protein LOC130770621 n=1 Tax=Actinidia eriantha TaxID=165200 RepID=UPI0025841D51|nr:uncharacterized protein LOC130770621 [Actinidia eriantha]
MSTREATHSSESSDDTPSIHNSRTHSKSKCSIQSLIARFKAKRSISEPKLLENNHIAASSCPTTSDNDDHRDGARALSNLLRQDFYFMKEAIAEVKNHVDHVDGQINQACQKFEELQTRGSSERELHEVKKAVSKLKSQIPSQFRTHSADSNPHRNSWPDINKSSDEMTHLYEEPKSGSTMDSAHIRRAFPDLPNLSQHFLLCFFLFPPKAVIKKRVMFYLMAANIPYWTENIANSYIDVLIRSHFIEPVYQKCSLVPDSFRMPLSVRSALSNEGMSYVNTSKYNMGEISVFRDTNDSYLINIDESIIDGDLFENKTRFTIFYLGRWQSSATHHIEVGDTKVLYGLKNMNNLSFLSLRGISMITELPTFISELTSLKILDLKACHNLEVVPDGIGSLTRLTHLDVSECYFLENMPRSLANLSKLQVLKGFFIGDSKNNKRSCTLEDLSGLQRLRKLNIYTSVKDFPEERHLSALQKFEALQNLTISWGGCSLLVGSNEIPVTRKLSIKPDLSLPSRLQKLDLHCFHGTSPPNWLRLSNMKELRKLYIRGGQLCYLDKSPKLNASDQCTVEILCLKYLGKLKMDLEDLMILFPKLIFLHKVECPNLTNIPCNKSGVWKRQGH